MCRDAMAISLMDTFTSLLSCVTTFSILGHLAHESSQDITQVAQAGPGMAFIAFPEAIAKFTIVPQVISNYTNPYKSSQCQQSLIFCLS